MLTLERAKMKKEKEMYFPLREHDRVFTIKEIKGKVYVQQNKDIHLVREKIVLEKKKMKCKHNNDKIIHGIYNNYLWCPDCNRTRGKKKAFTKPKECEQKQ